MKGYAYSFRHMYGKEGARKNYTPYSCMKIIMGTPPEAGAHHGCPFRYYIPYACCIWCGVICIVPYGLSGTWATPV